MGRYEDAFRRSLADPAGFWAEAAAAVDWYQDPQVILDDSNPPFYKWFAGGTLNTCYNALDRHVDGGRGEQHALIYDSPVTGTAKTFTYRQLRDETARFAAVLKGLDIQKGDRVVIYMPMIPEAVVAMLACARLGAIHSVVFGGFAAHELAVRIDDATPKLIVSASCGIEGKRIIEYKPILDKAIDEAVHKPAATVIVQRPQATAAMTARDLDWHELMAAATGLAPCVAVDATDPLYILYTSGTTGKPKGVVRDNGGHAAALTWSMRNVYDTGAGEVFWAASDIGWVVGHSYIVYAPLLAGCTTILYEGKPVGTPDAGAFWRVISEHNVKSLFTAPTGFRAIRKEDPQGTLTAGYDLSRFRYLFLAGERLDPDTYRWAADLLKVPVIDHWWQTETGWAIAADPMGLDPKPTKPGSPTFPMPGYDLRILDEDGNEAKPGDTGHIAIRLPLPPSCLPTLWHDDEGFIRSYLARYPGYYLTGDGGYRDADGYLYVMGRTDDVINVAGHRLSTGEMEEVLASHPAVAECAVFGVADELKGEVPRGLVVLKAGVTADPEALAAELAAMIRERIGPIAALRTIDVVPGLPKTRSGKILRKTMRGIANGKDEPVPSTIDDPAVLAGLRPILLRRNDPG
ncbi:MAG: propionyl-CoA synthetase [Trebonia sp.]|uniref:propionyl-CoA synthetase n=1 Tax=Trebonia sp. TaxID=2767075 RepID=UPI003BB1BD91